MEPLNGSQKHGLQRKARKQLTCLDEELATNDLTRAERATLGALREFLLEQWIPHIQEAEVRMDRFDEIYLIAQRVDIWLTGACWVIKRGLPGLVLLGGLIFGAGRLGSSLGLW